MPFRPFVRAGDDGETHVIGLIYHHWVADSISIRTLRNKLKLYNEEGVPVPGAWPALTSGSWAINWRPAKTASWLRTPVCYLRTATLPSACAAVSR